MSRRMKLLLWAFLAAIAMGCRTIPVWKPSPTPLPGWRLPVSLLLVDDAAFPEGWVRVREFPDIPNPTINHVYRQWWGQKWGDARSAYQAIWRAYTIEDAREKFAQLRQQSMFLPNFTPSPWDFYVKFTSPSEISFRSQIADEFYLACGWLGRAQCHVIARYRNYVSYMVMDLEAEYGERTSVGLTYLQIEAVIQAMDAKFAETMRTFYPEGE